MFAALLIFSFVLFVALDEYLLFRIDDGGLDGWLGEELLLGWTLSGDGSPVSEWERC